jgi:hypothetical protein
MCVLQNDKPATATAVRFCIPTHLLSTRYVVREHWQRVSRSHLHAAKSSNRQTITDDDYGLRGESSQPACSDYVADIAGRSSTVIVARNRSPMRLSCP